MRRLLMTGCALLVLGGASIAQANALGGAVIGGVGGAVVGSHLHRGHWWRHHHYAYHHHHG